MFCFFSCFQHTLVSLFFFFNVHIYCFCMYVFSPYRTIMSNSNNANWLKSDSGNLWSVVRNFFFLFFFFEFEKKIRKKISPRRVLRDVQRSVLSGGASGSLKTCECARLEREAGRVFLLCPDLCLESERQWVAAAWTSRPHHTLCTTAPMFGIHVCIIFFFHHDYIWYRGGVGGKTLNVHMCNNLSGSAAGETRSFPAGPELYIHTLMHIV